jgi:hypothetical protein
MIPLTKEEAETIVSWFVSLKQVDVHVLHSHFVGDVFQIVLQDTNTPTRNGILFFPSRNSVYDQIPSTPYSRTDWNEFLRQTTEFFQTSHLIHYCAIQKNIYPGGNLVIIWGKMVLWLMFGGKAYEEEEPPTVTNEVRLSLLEKKIDLLEKKWMSYLLSVMGGGGILSTIQVPVLVLERNGEKVTIVRSNVDTCMSWLESVDPIPPEGIRFRFVIRKPGMYLLSGCTGFPRGREFFPQSVGCKVDVFSKEQPTFSHPLSSGNPLTHFFQASDQVVLSKLEEEEEEEMLLRCSLMHVGEEKVPSVTTVC